MIWVQHDFYKNFTSSVDSNDIGFALDIFRSEISDLLTYKSDVLYGLFDKLNIKYKKKSSYSELLDIILFEIKSNEKFVRGLSFLIGESNQIIKNNKGVSFEKLLNGITKGIKKIAKYFIDFPKEEKRFRRSTLDMIGLKSSITGDDERELHKKDNTVLWVLGIIAVGVAGYLIYRYFDKKNDAKLKAESLDRINKMANGGVANTSIDVPITSSTVTAPIGEVVPVTTPTTALPQNLEAGYNVSSDVLVPVQPVSPAPMQNVVNNVPQNNGMGVNIQVQPMNNPNASMGQGTPIGTQNIVS